jgi:hypothetical protein
MELLLNLCWLLLALPAYLVWRRDTRAPGSVGKVYSRSALLLGCVLMLLFPVISATDDLSAVRAETEESSAAKIFRSANDKSAPGTSHCGSTPAQSQSLFALDPGEYRSGLVNVSSTSSITLVVTATAPSRAPPVLAFS